MARNAILAVLISATMFLTACATLDNVLLKRAKTPEGKELFIDNITHERTASPVDATGKPNEPAFESVPSDAVGSIATLFNLIPAPWNGVAFAGLSLMVSGYAAVRFRNKAALLAAAKAAGMAVVQRVWDDYKAGIIDADKDGVVTLSEAVEYLKAKAITALSPDALMKIVEIVADALLTEPQRQAKLEAIAVALKK